LEIYHHLSEEDVVADSSWLLAPVLVSTDHERMNSTKEKAILWAKAKKTHVYKWSENVSKHVNPVSPQKIQQTIMESISNFWQKFVEGAPAYLSETSKGKLVLVNESPVTMHCLARRRMTEYKS
jgi:hypothetical protein